MQYKTYKSKILLTLLAFGVILWIGGAIARLAIAYDLFLPGTELILKNYYTDIIRLHTVHLFAMTGLYTGVGFSVCLLIALIIFFKSKSILKKQGWLFMAFVLFFLTVPFESYMMYLDIRLNMAFWSGKLLSFNDYNITSYFLIRFSKLGIPSVLSFFAVLTSVVMIIWRPLNKLN